MNACPTSGLLLPSETVICPFADAAGTRAAAMHTAIAHTLKNFTWFISTKSTPVERSRFHPEPDRSNDDAGGSISSTPGIRFVLG